MPWIFKGKKRANGATAPKLSLKTAYRSKLEERGAKQLEASGAKWSYETDKIAYIVPSRKARYTPDFPIGDPKTGRVIHLEFKGRFRTASERQKMILVTEQNPELDIRLVFQKAGLPIYKGSPTSHGSWAEAHGFKWADNGVIPQAWINEVI